MFVLGRYCNAFGFTNHKLRYTDSHFSLHWNDIFFKPHLHYIPINMGMESERANLVAFCETAGKCSNCRAERGIRVKTDWSRGNFIRHVQVRAIEAGSVLVPARPRVDRVTFTSAGNMWLTLFSRGTNAVASAVIVVTCYVAMSEPAETKTNSILGGISNVASSATNFREFMRMGFYFCTFEHITLVPFFQPQQREIWI